MNEFLCSFSDCGQTFRTKYQLKSHQLLKHNDFWKCRAKTLTTRLNATTSGVTTQCNSLIKNLLTVNDTQCLKDNENIISDGLLTADLVKKEQTTDDNDYDVCSGEQLMPIVKIEESDQKYHVNDVNSDEQTNEDFNEKTISSVNENSTPNRFACSDCPKTFAYNSSLCKHRKTTHKEKTRSYRKSINDKIFSCNLCEKSFASIFSMCRHQTRYHSNGLLRNHNSIGNSNAAKKRYTCDVCDEEFISKYYVFKHKNSVHRVTDSVLLTENSECAKGVDKKRANSSNSELFGSDSELNDDHCLVSNNTSDSSFPQCNKKNTIASISDAESVNKNIEQKQENTENSGDSNLNKSEESNHKVSSSSNISPSSGKCAKQQRKQSSDKLFYELTTTTGNNQKYYACVECGKRFLFSASAVKHHQRAHAKQRYFCDVFHCTFYSFNKLDLSIHRSLSHSAQHYEQEFGHLNIGVNDNASKKCTENHINKDLSAANDEFIGLTFPDSDLLDVMKNSENSNHPNGQQLRTNSVDTDEYCCDIVDDDGNVIDRHLESRDDNENNEFLFLLCPICGVRNGSLSDLRCHLDRTHSTERELSMRYACVVCQKRFMFLGQLIAHKNTYHRHKCDIGDCKRYFRCKYELRFHQYSAHNVIKLNSVYW